ncbi:hypothetical protein R3X25_00005, partial [Lutibacter sp. TH_r2]|uniref:hypothetical protein n=1 Tax=Lutibacter sp. TH_r2 TaxID=3082083 RepID=UPI0029532B2E
MINILNKKNTTLIILVICAMVFSLKTNAQQVTVINHKGTKVDVNNNNVYTATVAPVNPLENDVWFDTANNLTKIFDGTNWIPMGGVNSTFEVVGNDLQITDSNGTLSVPISS